MMIIAEMVTWRIACKHPGSEEKEAGSSELLYQLDGRFYILSRQPISMRSVKSGQTMAGGMAGNSIDRIMSLVDAW